MERIAPIEWLAECIEVADNGCWLWTGYIRTDGYGQVKARRYGFHGRLAHIFMWEQVVGSRAADLTFDHACHNLDMTCRGGRSCLHRRCVNPVHLTQRTMGDNTRASRHAAAGRNARRTHCAHGHEFTEENTRVYVLRQCIACEQSRKRKR